MEERHELPSLDVVFCACGGHCGSLTSHSYAATLTWDGDPATAGIQGTTGDWLLANGWQTSGGVNTSWVAGSDALVGVAGTQIGRSTSGTASLNDLTLDASFAGTTFIIETNVGNRPLTFVADGSDLPTITVPVGKTLNIEPQPNSAVDLTITGGGRMNFAERAPTGTAPNAFTGKTFIANGTVGFLGSTVRGSISLFGTEFVMGTSGDNSATTLDLGGDFFSPTNVAQPLTVTAGYLGAAKLIVGDTTTNGDDPITWQGNWNLGQDLQVDRPASGGQFLLNVDGNITGSGDLSFTSTGFLQTSQYVRLNGYNSGHTGSLSMTGNSSGDSTLQFNGTQGNSNINLQKVAASGSGTLRYNISSALGDLITLANTATLDLSGLSLQPVVGSAPSLAEYILIDTTTGVSGSFASIIDTYSAYNFTVDYDGTIANPGKVVLLVTVVPEPASLSFLALASVACLRRRRGA